MEKVIAKIQSDIENFNLEKDDRSENPIKKNRWKDRQSPDWNDWIILVSDLRNEILNLEEKKIHSLHINSNICKYIRLDETNCWMESLVIRSNSAVLNYNYCVKWYFFQRRFTLSEKAIRRNSNEETKERNGRKGKASIKVDERKKWEKIILHSFIRGESIS